MKNSLDEPNLKDKFSAQEIEEINTKCDEVHNWLQQNPDLSSDEIDAKHKELESTFNPIMQRAYQQSANRGAADVNMEGSAPQHAEMDLD